MTIIGVRPEDVREYGSSAAIVLSVLRLQGCTASMPVLVQFTDIGRLCGLDYRAVSRALDRLKRGKVISVSRYRERRSLMVRMRDGAVLASDSDATGQNLTTQVDGGGLPTPAPPLSGPRPALSNRLDSVRALLDAVG